jgi:NAD(P)-dependent dehydrogenase (short-subunit alcohol dehydrogenase family)
MDFGLKDKVALVTGAGSQVGFGRQICLTLAEEGCNIIASDIDFEGAQKTAAQVEAMGRKSLAVKADITNKADAVEMVKQALAKFGKIDILVNNAGAILGGGPFLNQDEALWDRELALNLKGAMIVTQAVLPNMMENKYGKIVNISSDTAKHVAPHLGVSMYNIAKTGVFKFTRDLAASVIGHGIFVNSVSPGWSLDTAFAKMPDKKAAEEMFKKETPSGKGCTPRDIAVAVAFFASDLSGDIVGQILSISGGSTFQ